MPRIRAASVLLLVAGGGEPRVAGA